MLETFQGDFDIPETELKIGHLPARETGDCWLVVSALNLFQKPAVVGDQHSRT